MFCAVDVDYRTDAVVAAVVGFSAWEDELPTWEDSLYSRSPAAPYEPGEFFRRELPYLLELLARRPLPDVIIVDGFVWLGPGQPGLGAHLHTSLSAASAVVGVAKRPYRGTSVGEPLLRGTSQVPLHVSAVGLAVEKAVAGIARMHGGHRVPTLLKRVDRLSREA